MNQRSSLRFAGTAALVLGLAACGKSGGCVPTPASPCPGDTPPPQNVTSVTVTSPTVGTTMAVGATAQLEATATVDTGTPPTTFTWSATPAGVASVNSAGVVTANSAGTMTISAMAGGTTGMLQMEAVLANLAGIPTLTADPFFVALVGELTTQSQTEINAALTTCATHVASGNLIALDACILSALNTTSGGANDDALYAVIDLYLELALDYVGLGT